MSSYTIRPAERRDLGALSALAQAQAAARRVVDPRLPASPQIIPFLSQAETLGDVLSWRHHVTLVACRDTSLHPVSALRAPGQRPVTGHSRAAPSERASARPARGRSEGIGGAAGREPAAPLSRTTSLGGSAPSSLPERPGPVRSDDASPFVVRLMSRDAETRYECPLLSELLVGRAGHGGTKPDIDLTNLNGVEQGVSRRHARIVRAGDDAALEDLNSLNGTFIGGHRLTPGHPEVIRPGDELQFGKIILVVSR
jgi:FHA domain